MAVTKETPIGEIIAKYDALGVSYASAFEAEVARVKASHLAMCNWQPADFVAAAAGDKLTQGDGGGKAPKELLAADKKLLQSSGPVRTHYRYARTEKIPEFGL